MPALRASSGVRRRGPPIGKTKRDTYATRAGADRGLLRNVLNMDLVCCSGDLGAEMLWDAEAFRQSILLRYCVYLMGWPRDIEFRNPSKMSVGEILRLLQLFEERRLRFRRATAGEIFAARESVYNGAPAIRFPAPGPRTCRRDMKQRRARPTVDAAKYPPRYARDGPKSKRWIGESTDEEEGSRS